MSEKQTPEKRAFYQSHLWTALLMMLLAAGFLANNAIPNVYEIPSSWGVNEADQRDFEEWYGRPSLFLCLYKGSRQGIPFSKPRWYFLSLVSDVITGLGSIVVLGSFLEYLIRSREAR
jgi:hypothetical protein